MPSSTTTTTSFIESHTPRFATIWWDNIKTSACWGAIFPGSIVAGPMSVAGAAIGTALAGAPELGMATGAIGAAPFAALSSLLFSLPLTWIAHCSRKFMINEEIEASLALLDTYAKSDATKRYLIQAIINADDHNAWGIRSYNSYSLKQKLLSEDRLDEKWDDLSAYLNEKNSDGAYIHNGKKLFNTILATIDSTHDNAKDLSIQATLANNIKYMRPIDEILSQRSDLVKKPLEFHGNKTPIRYAVEQNNREATDYLVKQGEVKTNLWKRAGGENIFNYLIKDDISTKNRIDDYRKNLGTLTQIINCSYWHNQKSRFVFWSTTPKLILKLRALFQNKDINTLSNYAIFILIRKLKNLVSHSQFKHCHQQYDCKHDLLHFIRVIQTKNPIVPVSLRELQKKSMSTKNDVQQVQKKI